MQPQATPLARVTDPKCCLLQSVKADRELQVMGLSTLLHRQAKPLKKHGIRELPVATIGYSARFLPDSSKNMQQHR